MKNTQITTECYALDRDNLAQVARINFYLLDLNSSLKNIYKNVFGFAVYALEIMSLIFLGNPVLQLIHPFNFSS